MLFDKADSQMQERLIINFKQIRSEEDCEVLMSVSDASYDLIVPIAGTERSSDGIPTFQN